MNHQLLLWTLQSLLDFVFLFGPAAGLGLLAWRVAR